MQTILAAGRAHREEKSGGICGLMEGKSSANLHFESSRAGKGIHNTGKFNVSLLVLARMGLSTKTLLDKSIQTNNPSLVRMRRVWASLLFASSDVQSSLS